MNESQTNFINLQGKDENHLKVSKQFIKSFLRYQMNFNFLYKEIFKFIHTKLYSQKLNILNESYETLCHIEY